VFLHLEGRREVYAKQQIRTTQVASRCMFLHLEGRRVVYAKQQIRTTQVASRGMFLRKVRIFPNLTILELKRP
jgi:hypothetical protein